MYIEIYELSDVIRTEFILSELEDVKKFKLEVDKNEKVISIEQYEYKDFNTFIGRALENLIEKYIKAIWNWLYNLYGFWMNIMQFLFKIFKY